MRWVLTAGITAVAVAGAVAGAVVATPLLLEAALLQTVRNVAQAQADSYRATGSYFTELPSEFTNPTTVLWPVHAEVLATCPDGYVIKASVDGTHRYLSSEHPTTPVTTLTELALPACIDPHDIGLEVPTPPVVTGLAAARHQDIDDQLGEGAEVTWAPVTECPVHTPVEYRATFTNTRPDTQPATVMDTTTPSVVQSGIWNGSTYTVTVQARCGSYGDWNPAATLSYTQELPTPEPPTVVTDPDTGKTTITLKPVSSSPLTAYMIEYQHDWDDDWTSLMPHLKQPTFEFYPPEYDYERGDLARIQARTDTDTPTAWSTETEIQPTP